MWSNILNGGSDTDKKEIKFVKLSEGTTTIRIVDAAPVSRWRHFIPQANNGKGYGVNCIGKGCPICAENKKAVAEGKDKPYNATLSHAINVLVNGEVQVLDKGNSIMKPIAEWSTKLSLNDHDIEIKTSGKGLLTKYSVMPNFPARELTAKEVEACKDKADLEEFKKLLTVEEVKTLMEGGSLNKEEEQQPSNNISVDFTKSV